MKEAIDAKRLARAKELMSTGLVHVTGLPVTRGDEECGPIQTRRNELAHHDANNGKVVLITEDGEVWIGVGSDAQHEMCLKYAREMGAFVPCSNGEQIETHLILARIADPYADHHGMCFPIPRIKAEAKG